MLPVVCVNRPAKISDLDLVVETDEEVFRFDVAMNDILRELNLKKLNIKTHLVVEVLEGLCRLGNIGCRTWFLKVMLALDHLVQLALSSILEDEEHALVVVEIAVHAQHIWVAQGCLDFDFTDPWY